MLSERDFKNNDFFIQENQGVNNRSKQIKKFHREFNLLKRILEYISKDSSTYFRAEK